MKTKKSIQLLLIALMVFMPMVVSAFNGEVVIAGIKYYINTDDQTAEVRANWFNYENTYSGDVVIPETVEYEGVTCRVTSIGDSAFKYCYNLTSITIPNSVTSIGEDAFFYCSGLTYFITPNSVTSIGDYAFCYCWRLVRVTIPNSVTSIGVAAFAECSCLTSITIPNSVTSIGNSTFEGCSRLPSITIPNSVTSIGSRAFRNCINLTSIIIPNSVISLGDGPFEGCSGLISLAVESENPVYDTRDNCNAIIRTSDNVLIAGCRNTTIPNSVTSIGNYAFDGCTSLASTTIPNSVTSIGKGVFYKCSSLASVTIPSSVTSIGNQAFAYCAELTNVYCHADEVPSTGPNAFDNSETRYATLHVPNASIENYKQSSPWSEFGTIVGLSGSETQKCAKPTIYYSEGKLSYKSETEGVVFFSNITDTDMGSYSDEEVQLSVTYHISVYAAKNGYQDSDVAEATLCWIEVDPQKEGISEETATEAKQLQALPVLIQAEEGQFSVEGVPEGTKVAVYDAGGVEVGTAISRGGKTLVPAHLPQGSIAIVKIGEKAVKVAVK